MSITVSIILVAFLASLIRSTFGFGEALVAVPLLALFLPLKMAVPLAVMLSIAVAILVVLQDHRHIHIQSAKWLIIYTLPGIPIGLYLMLQLKENVTKAALGILICLFALYCLLKKAGSASGKRPHLWLVICGFLSGILGGAFGLNGPPLVYYGDRQGWSAQHFRATLQAYFLPASSLALLGYIIKGMVSETVLYYFLIALPSTIVAIYIGRWLNKQFTTTSFFKIVYTFLLLLGTILLWDTLR